MALSREQATDIFWRSRAPFDLSDRASAARVLYVEELPPVSLVPPPVHELDQMMPADEVFYYLEGQSFGNTLYVAVMHEGHVIVPPFSIDQRENLPSMRPANL